ncbi:POU domain, class 3, transcription factor 2-like [Penaeus monodon]|uniref:POU domain, class 3, transcription factor 2-like n=1 Tax=Penaeus monodon TaxID=6687 RepID=UPI0018A709AC|nr:POU domain, class 3, transcription factor 2-like [Penaeus monodon]
MPPRFQKRREFERQRNGVSGSGGGGGSSSNNGGGGGGGGGGGSKRGRGTPVSSSVLGSGGVGVVLTPANKPGVKEGTPETTEEADWETASESSDPEARKENKEKASNPAPKPDHRKGSKTDRKIGGGSWAPSSGVVIVDDQPQVSELIGDILDSNDGFQQVTRRKSGKEKGKPLPEETISAAAATAVVTEATGTAGTTTVSGPAPSSNAKKQPKEKKSRSSKSSGFERSRQSKLPQD